MQLLIIKLGGVSNKQNSETDRFYLLQGCTGEQLSQITDKGLLQLGVQDAAERQALLAARGTIQQQQQPQQQQQQQQSNVPAATAAGQVEVSQPSQSVMVLPTRSALPGAGGAAVAADGQGAAGANGAVSDKAGGAEGAQPKAVAVRWVGQHSSARRVL